ncbi:MAG: 30S ribosomal protein S16 [Anaerolineae bacterium]|jgi:small subunit ribosomal protein S16|nr:30S ribosomal protein S16 [Anaerolineae bacterium]
MVRIRLTRVGSKRQPSYRIVIIDRERARDSRYIEAVGFYNPRTQPATMTVKEDRVLYWLSVGAQPSDTVSRILKSTGTLDRFARFRAGESIESLAAEAEAAKAETETVSPKTRYPAPTKKAVAEPAE